MTDTPASQSPTTIPKRLSKMPSNQAVNVHDLLNFSLPPRQQRPFSSLSRRSRKTGNVQGVWNKERFVNAQYRFVMNPTGDYTVHFADPDIFFQWNDILQVIIPRSSALASAAAPGELSSQEGCTSCPICLSPPTAPRMTKCGHVFCYPCILHYLSTSENKWARCPICFDSVHARQLKTVKWYDGPLDSDESPSDGPAEGSSSSSTLENAFEISLHAGSLLMLRLVQRPQITTLALPRSQTWPSDLLPPHQAPFYFLPDVYQFAKFMLATPTYLISDLTRNLDDLTSERRVLSAMNDPLSVMFIDAAVIKVREQIEKAAALESAILKETIEKAHRDQHEIEERFAFYARRKKAEEEAHTAISEVPHDFLAHRPGAALSSVPSPTDAPLPRHQSQSRNQPRQRRNLNPPPPSTSTYYYYQVASGLPLFLHPLDIRILLSHFHSYSSFPDTITVRVESVSEGSVNDDLRKRCKYLGHLPEGADVVFIEADLEGVVGSEGLKNFEGPLKMRAAKRKEKEKKEEKARIKAEEREKERLNMPSSAWSASTAERVQVPDRHEPAEDFSALGDIDPSRPSHSDAAAAPAAPGAWGTRSFASALHSAASGQRSGVAGQQPRPPRLSVEDEWDIDVAWHELEQRSGGQRRKRSNKLVVLGSGGGGARRR